MVGINKVFILFPTLAIAPLKFSKEVNDSITPLVMSVNILAVV